MSPYDKWKTASQYDDDTDIATELLNGAQACRWKQAIDDALVCCHLGTADDFESPKHALAALERWHYDLGVSGVCEPKKASA